MKKLRRKSPLGSLRHFALKKSSAVLVRVQQALFLGPDVTRWLNRLLKEPQLTPEQRSRLAFSGAWLAAPLTVAQDILNGVRPDSALGQQKKSRLFAETLCDIEPAILYRHWPGNPNDLERMRRLLGKVVEKQIPAVVPVSFPDS
jgi:hypothetical protein